LEITGLVLSVARDHVESCNVVSEHGDRAAAAGFTCRADAEVAFAQTTKTSGFSASERSPPTSGATAGGRRRDGELARKVAVRNRRHPGPTIWNGEKMPAASCRPEEALGHVHGSPRTGCSERSRCSRCNRMLPTSTPTTIRDLAADVDVVDASAFPDHQIARVGVAGGGPRPGRLVVVAVSRSGHGAELGSITSG
jgi:hypothetical protein